MAFVNFINVLPIHIAIDYYKLKPLSSKIKKAASTIGFIQPALFHELTPKLEKVKGQFINHKDRYSAVKSILNSQLLEHSKNLNRLSYGNLHRTTLRNKIGMMIYRFIIEVLLKSLRESNILQLKLKNNKLHRLISQKSFKRNDHNIPVVKFIVRRIRC